MFRRRNGRHRGLARRFRHTDTHIAGLPGDARALRAWRRGTLAALLALATACGGGAPASSSVPENQPAGRGGTSGSVTPPAPGSIDSDAGAGGGGQSLGGAGGNANGAGGANGFGGSIANPDADPAQVHTDGGVLDQTGDRVPAPDQNAPAEPAPAPVPPDRGPINMPGCPPETAQPRVLFDIPRAGDRSDDFFRLPFPNDIRRRGGKLALVDFPRPQGFLFPNIIGKVADAISAEGVGFGPNPVVTFRLSRAPSLTDPAKVITRYLDLTEGAPEYGRVVAHRVGTTTPGRYLCGHHVLVERADPTPLLSGHTYAVMLTRALTDQAGTGFSRDTDFAVMLGAQPDGVERLAAWQAYAPLRRYFASTPNSADEVLAAAVFTVDAVEAPAAALRAAIHTGAAPTVTDLVRCGPGVASVCDDGRTSGCGSLAADAAFDEYQARMAMPVFQQGTAPYNDAGGGISFDSAGRAIEVRREPVCVSLTVPKGQAPAAGWPVVVYAHGTGGHFRGPVESGLADDLARGVLGGGAAQPMATLSYDGVLHGSRKNGSTRGSDELVYNVFNPTAARDNQLQAAADLFAVVRALPALSGGERPLDGSKVGLYGHSQGGNAAAVAAGYEPAFKVVVLSGTGGGIANSLLEKKKPIDAASILSIVLAESITDPRHPALQLLQQYFDRADPLNHGRRITAAPMSGSIPRHLLHVFGATDSYAPESTQWAFAVGAGLPIANPVMPSDRLAPLLTVLAPVRGNFKVGVTSVTALEAQYRPDGYDGHFVSSQNPTARADIRHFLGTYFRDASPELQ
jgi:dienelactone hydrolase